MAAAPSENEQQQQQQYPTAMSEAERYLFDLNGYIIIRNVLTPDQIAKAHAAIDAHISEAIPRSDPTLRNAIEGSPMYGTGPPRLDLGGILEWDSTESEVFKSILAHPRLVPLFHGLLGKGYRLDHIPFVLLNNKGGEGFQLHGGTVDCVSGEYNHNLAYTCHNGSIRSSLLGCNVMLVDHNPGDGGFCVVPGSHKSNFKMPEGMVDGRSYFSADGVVGGAAPSSCSWPSKFYDDLNDAQRAVLEPPYANRLDRPNICEDGTTVEITQRSDRKRQHDKEVFKTKYF